MKGLNTARIAALATTLALGVSVVHAGTVLFENEQIVTQNGQPVAKVVVGANSGIADGIAAANIAAALAQYTYGTKSVTATPTGLEGLSCGAGTGTSGGSSTGACEVTDKKVQIEITVPGQLANAHQFKTLITDSIDKQLANRQNTLSEDMYNDSLSSSDTSNILSPLRGVYSGQSAYSVYRIGENQFNQFANDKNTPVKDEQATSDFTYVAEQGFWVGTNAPTSGVYYDSNSAYRQVIAKPQVVAYNVRFLGNDYGIPYCTIATNSTTWVTCKSDNDKTQRHRVAIPFLGQKWVISEMTVPTTAVSTANGAMNGGKVKLAKEADYRIISIGEQIDAGTFKVRLADISVAVGSTNTHPAIMDVLDANDQVIGQIQVTPGDTYTFTQSSTGSQIKVHVYQTAGGLTLSAKWAEIAIYTDEITLEDGKRYNGAASDDVNWKNVYASLLWKSRDASSTGNESNSLREIVLYVDDMQTYLGGENRMKGGDSVVFPKKDSVYRLTYNGLDLGDADYASLSMRSDSGRTLVVGTSADCNTKNGNATWTGTFIKVSSDKDNAFGGSSASAFGTDDRVSEFYVDPIGNYSSRAAATCSATTGVCVALTQTAAQGEWNTSIFWKPSGCSYYKVGGVYMQTNDSMGSNNNLGKSAMTINTSTVKFDVAGDDSSSPGLIAFGFAVNTSTSMNTTLTNSYSSNIQPSSAPYIIGEIVLQEDAGKLNTVSHHVDMIRIPVYNLTSSDWRFKSADSSTATTYYNALNMSLPANASNVLNPAISYELPLYTERGTKVTGVSLTDVSMRVATKIGQPTFTFAGASTTQGSESSEVWTAKEGDSKTLSNGVKLGIKSIDVKVGSCTASVKDGGVSSCTLAGKNGVSAVADPAEALVPYFTSPTGIKGMVIKDTDGDAKTAGAVRISVGGPLVNSLTMDSMKAAEQDTYFDSQTTLVKAFGKTIVVAGKSGDNTIEAANAFISQLKTQ